MMPEDYIAQKAIDDGTEKLEEDVKKKESIELRFTDSELIKIQQLISILTLSKELFLESAISYVHFHFSNDKEKTEKIINDESRKYEAESQQIDLNGKISPKDRDRLYGKIKLSPETSSKIEELNMKDKINQCLFTGINLLYKQLIEEVKTAKE
ncbi:hypothetical protein VB711_13760 [Cronbergia sp. UHCC 0137]|uniref:hypothetical protein n=1 Tax=Cronbergia sp. UHCC 0137 TaxID=3110239 RepID=UPI002B215696|nr:hypothetical protein [Cronbergia sp. UHCC 0137]MEA5618896.1 hypothetical protein [Cronbergia sp. UHCC 0137]